MMKPKAYFWLGGATVPTRWGVLCFRAPWERPLFSERAGRHRSLFNGWGWRLFLRKTT